MNFRVRWTGRRATKLAAVLLAHHGPEQRDGSGTPGPSSFSGTTPATRVRPGPNGRRVIFDTRPSSCTESMPRPRW
jgi:hypothetical protein